MFDTVIRHGRYIVLVFVVSINSRGGVDGSHVGRMGLTQQANGCLDMTNANVRRCMMPLTPTVRKRHLLFYMIIRATDPAALPHGGPGLLGGGRHVLTALPWYWDFIFPFERQSGGGYSLHVAAMS
jgi:hypothetical protein